MLKQLFKPIHIVIGITGVIGLFLLLIRVKQSQSVFLLFLIWNLFLAYIPVVISNLVFYYKWTAYKLVAAIGVWLLFLPNAPYILTDFKHLHSQSEFFWLDAFCIGFFALSGLLAGLSSMQQFHHYLKEKMAAKVLNISMVLICLASGFGIYLGRFLRWNSWDILHHPLALIKDILRIIIQPHTHQLAWGITIGFGGFIGLCYVLLYYSVQPKKE